MGRTNLCLTLFLCLVGMSVVASGQDQKQKAQKKRGQRRGQGLTAVVSFGGRGNSLVAHPKVQADLKLADDQKSKLTAAVKKANAASRVRGLGDLSPEERRAKYRELAKKTRQNQAELAKAIKETLNEDQTERFEQIKLQTRGLAALLDEEIQKKLNVTDEQKKKMKDLRVDLRKKRGVLVKKQQAGEIEKREYSAQSLKLQRDGDKQLLATLTSEQQDAFKKLKGKALDLGFRRGGLQFRRLPRQQKKAKKAVKRDDL